MEATLEKSRDKTVIPLKVSAEIVRKLTNDIAHSLLYPLGLRGGVARRGSKSRAMRGIAIAQTAMRDLLNYDRCSV
jgi:hypothetical protein